MSHLIDLVVNAAIALSNRALAVFLVVATVFAVATVVIWIA